MKLRYILGIPGSGKSTLCINEILKAADEGKNALYIVPEQFSLESERLLSSAAKNHILMNSEVLSFAHLAHRILLKTGGSSEKILDDNGKVLLLRKIIGELIKSDSLVFYGKSAARQGFIDNMSALITEFTRYSIPPEEISEKAGLFYDKNRSLSDKLHDIGEIYKSFNQNISQRYIAKDSLLDILAERIRGSHMFENTSVWIDSFTDFTPQEFKVIEALLETCDSVNIALTTHSPSLNGIELNRFDPYFEAKRSIRHITRFAESNNIKTEPLVFMEKDLRHSLSPELEHLTYAYFDGKKYSRDCKNILISSASSIETELSHTAGEILSLLRDKANPCKCSDIAVLVSSDSYYLPLKNIFEKYNIPFFTDVRRDILTHPLTELVRSFFKVLSSNNGTPAVFRMLKTGFNDFTAEEIALTENYCKACGIRGKKWFDEWGYTLNGKYENKLDELNDIRLNICDILEHISSLRKSSKTVRGISESIYTLLDYFDVKQRLSALIDKAREDNNEDAVRLHTMIWDTTGSIFSKMCEIMGEDKITLDEYGKLLETGIQNASLSLIPPTCESVTIAQFNRSRLPDIKVLFMLGVNEGIVPPHHNDTNLLSDNDRCLLMENGCELGGDNMRLINRDRYNVYSYITKPSQRLYLSYNTGLESGIKSSLIQDLCTAFDITVNEIHPTAESIASIYSDEQAFELLLRHMSTLKENEDISPLYKAVYAHLAENENYAKRLKNVSSWLNFSNPSSESIPEELAHRLYLTDEDTLLSGITGLQDYASCPYMYFLRHGLKAFEGEDFAPAFTDFGTFLHNILKTFSDKVQKERGWTNIDEQYINNNVEDIVNNTIANYNAGFFESTAVGKYMGERVKDTAISTISALSKNITGFIPCGYEIGFGPGSDKALPPLTYNLSDKAKLILTGSIDRVDLFTDSSNNTYVKITDYKSSNSPSAIFSEKKLFMGIQLQLPVYMQAYTNSSPSTKAGGFFYFKIDNPVFDSAKADAFSELLAGGVLVDNKEVFDAIPKQEQSKITGRSSAFFKIPERSIERLNNHVNGIITDMGSNIISGNINARPSLYAKDKSPCSYCAYSAVCCFELCSNKSSLYNRLDDDKLKAIHNEVFYGDE